MTATRDRLNAFLDLPQVAVASAQSGRLEGLKLGVKDIFDVAGYKTGCGNPDKSAETEIAEHTMPAVQLLLDRRRRQARRYRGRLGHRRLDPRAGKLLRTDRTAHHPWPHLAGRGNAARSLPRHVRLVRRRHRDL